MVVTAFADRLDVVDVPLWFDRAVLGATLPFDLNAAAVTVGLSI